MQKIIWICQGENQEAAWGLFCMRIWQGEEGLLHLDLGIKKTPKTKNKTGGPEQTKGGRKGRWDDNV